MALCPGGRALAQLRRTGSTGLAGLGGHRVSAERIGSVLFVAVAVLVLAAPLLDLVGTLLAQEWMGASWRVRVNEDKRTELIARGPFALVRNPILPAMIPAFLGLALLAPNAAATAAPVSALEPQVRFVEEPYLLRTHGTKHAAYASRVGRFVPGIARLGDGDVR